MTTHGNRPTIDRDERTRRGEALWSRAEQEGFDAVIAVSTSMRPGHVHWLTGYTPTNGTALAVLAGRSGVVLVCAEAWDADAARAASGLPADRVVAAVDPATAVLEQLPAGLSRLGVVGHGLLPAPWQQTFQGAHPALTIADATPLASALRRRKSPQELAVLRQAAHITDAGGRAFLDGVAAGVSEIELALAVEAALRRAGSGRLAFPLVLGGGPRTADVVAFPRDRLLEDGALVLLDVGATWDGYCGDLSRTRTVGPPDRDRQRILETTLAAHHAAAATLRPGVSAGDVHRAAEREVRAGGYGNAFLTGHGTGVDNQEPPLLDGRDETILEAGMVVTVEPGVYVPGVGGARIEDTFVITAGGAERLNDVPLDPWR